MTRRYVLSLSALVFGAMACGSSDTEDGTDGTGMDTDSEGTEMDTDSDTVEADVDPLIGDWDATQVTIDETTTVLPFEEVTEDGTDSFTSTQTIALQVTPEDASMVLTSLATDADDEPVVEESYTSVSSGLWFTGTESYVLTLTDEDIGDFTLSCTLDVVEELTCLFQFNQIRATYLFDRRVE